jgi:hypothetical protein
MYHVYISRDIAVVWPLGRRCGMVGSDLVGWVRVSGKAAWVAGVIEMGGPEMVNGALRRRLVVTCMIAWDL